MDPIQVAKPILEKALVRVGQVPQEMTPEAVAAYAQPLQGFPQLHYIANLAGQDMALSFYYMGDGPNNLDHIKQVGDVCNKERASGLNVAFQTVAADKRLFVAHLVTRAPGQEARLEEFLGNLLGGKKK